MDVIGDYQKQGFAHLRGLIPAEVARAFMSTLKEEIAPGPIPLSQVGEHPGVLRRPAYEVEGFTWKPISFFLWGLTPIMSELIGRDIVPSYSYFRIYREGDVCFVHSDRPASQHGISLTLDYSDGVPWDIEVALDTTDTLYPLSKDFGAGAYSSVSMEVGDALLYQGSRHAHGRMKPNPNAWSAHLFMFWVDRDGPYRDHAFDGKVKLGPVNFSFF